MYSVRVRILAASGFLVLLGIVARLAQLQLGSNSALQDRITQLKDQRGRSQSLKTVRGKILDRSGRVLAYDEPLFKLRIRYDLSRYLDSRVQQVMHLQTLKKTHPDKALAEVNQAIDAHLEILREIIARCSRFGDPCEVIEQKIQRYNDRIWNLRAFQAWRKTCTESPLYKQNAGNLQSVDLGEALADLERCVPTLNDRLLCIGRTDIAEMRGSSPLIELKTDDDLMAAQLEFTVDGVIALPEPVRVYPYKTAAAQTIGWVGEASQEKDRELFDDDPYARYLEGEDCGREDGVEYVCEPVLRGRRGRVVYDIDGTLSRRIPSRLGQDVRLTIDIELQQKIEEALQHYPRAPYCGPGMAAVVIDVAKGDVLAMVSLPTCDLNTVRYRYKDLTDPNGNQPLLNRALNRHYPPGSVVKPVILAAGLQAGLISPTEVIHCPSRRASGGFPDCWVFRKNNVGHDTYWENYARNAIKGSCNVYFSRLADRIEPHTLQEWLFAFGYGRQAQFACPASDDPNDQTSPERSSRRLRQASGQISSRPEYGAWVQSLDQVPPLDSSDRALVGIGEGKFSATPLQVAGAMAAMARGGVYQPPRLFLPSDAAPPAPSSPPDGTNLGLAEQTLETIYDGLHAVVNEENGTAHEAFRNNPPSGQGLRVYGKTGSTQRPDHAWFAGFAKDGAGRTIALALVVEGGQSGATDAAPLGRDIIGLCKEAGYLGR